MNISFIHPDIEEYIANLDVITGSKVAKIMEMLSIEEYHLGMPHSKKVEHSL